LAYSQNPTVTTYKTQRFNFVGSPQQRSGTSTKDQRFVNMFPEMIKTDITQGKKYYLKKRPGTALFSTPGTTGVGKGAYYWNGSLFTVVGDNLYRDNTFVMAITAGAANVGFTEGDGPYKYLFLCDGTKGWVIKTNWTVSPVVALSFPSPHIPTPLFVDGYIVVAKANSADIYNSNLEDPLNWTAGDFITAEMYPDNIVGLAKHLNYIAAFGQNNIEMFYDNANATGSPFARNATAVQQVGCAAIGSIVESEKETVFIGDTSTGGKTVWFMEGFKLTDIGLEAVEQSLAAEGSSISNAKAFIVRSMGHRFYVLNLTSRTWVYDFEEKLWHEWQYNGGVFPFNYCADNPSSMPYLIEKTTGFVVTLDQGIYQDAYSGGVYNMDCSVVTIKLDFDNFNRKFGHRFSLIGDVPNDTQNSTFYISWSDDDYKTFSTERQLIVNGDTASISQLGAFRRRAFKVRYSSNDPVRLEGFELDVNLGQQ
jgi:hypothetical protein